MAVKTFDEVYGQLSAEEKKLLDNTFAKHPDLKEGWLRQDDYSRKMNEIKSKETEYTEALAYNQKIQAWADVNVPKWEALAEAGIIDKETGQELWTKQKSDLEKQLEDARKAAIGGDMDPAELDKRVREIVKANGGVTPDELKAVIASEAKKLAEETFTEQWKTKENDFNTKTIPFVAGFSGANAIIATRYETQTGEQWDAEKQKALFKKMADAQNVDPFAVGGEMIEEAKGKKKALTMEEELKKLKEENEALRQGRSMPGGGMEPYIPTPGTKNPLQMMLDRSAGTDDVTSLVQKAAQEAGKELRSEGKIYGA